MDLHIRNLTDECVPRAVQRAVLATLCVFVLAMHLVMTMGRTNFIITSLRGKSTHTTSFRLGFIADPLGLSSPGSLLPKTGLVTLAP